jgi:hypothetical protein
LEFILKACLANYSLAFEFYLTSAQVATSPEALAVVVGNKELFGEIMDKASAVDDIQQYHVVAVSDPKLALSGPVTEVCRTWFSPTVLHCSYWCRRIVITVKNPETKATVEGIVNSFVKIAEGKYTYGWTAEDSNKAIVIASWDSVEVCLWNCESDFGVDHIPILKAQKARVQDPDVADTVREYMSLIDTNGGPFFFNFVAVWLYPPPLTPFTWLCNTRNVYQRMRLFSIAFAALS